MESRVPGFRGEFLWELSIAQIQLPALAAAVPEEKSGWSPADGARSFSAVLVHIAACNFALLHLAGKRAPGGVDLYGPLPEDPFAQIAAIVRKNVSLEQAVTDSDTLLMSKFRCLGARHPCEAEGGPGCQDQNSAATSLRPGSLN